MEVLCLSHLGKVLLIFLLTSCWRSGFCGSLISLNPTNGGYSGIVVSISPDLGANIHSKDHVILKKLEDLLTKASELLYDASGGWHFEEISFLLPTDAADLTFADKDATFETYFDADIRVEENIGTDFFTDQLRQCAEPGEAIYVDGNMLMKDSETHIEDVAARRFLQEWAKFRYGVFDEHNDNKGDKNLYPKTYTNSTGQLRKTGCTGSNAWNCDEDTEDGNCNFTGILQQISLMDNVVLKASHFCSNDSHNEKSPTSQNRFCDGNSTWEIIHKSEGAPPQIKKQTIPNFYYVVARPPPTVIIVDPELLKPAFKTAIRNAFNKLLHINYVHYVANTSLIMPCCNSFSLPCDNGTQVLQVQLQTEADLANYFGNPCTITPNWDYIVDHALETLPSSSIQHEGRMVFMLQQMNNTLNARISNLTMNEQRLRFYILTYSTAENGYDMPKTKWYNIPSSSCYPNQLVACDLAVWKSTEDAFFDIFQRPRSLAYNSSKIALLASEVHLRGFVEGNFHVPSTDAEACITVHYYAERGRRITVTIDGIEMTMTEITTGVQEYCIKTTGNYRYAVESPETLTPFFLTVRLEEHKSGKDGLPNVRTTVDKSFVDEVYIVRAIVRNRGSVVTGASVTAVLHRPGVRKENFELRDSGSGDPDIFASDGIYSGYVLPNRYAGVYDVMVEIKKKPDQTEPIDIVHAGSVKFPKSLNEIRNSLRPSRILDLRVQKMEGPKVTFEWTTPGEYLDKGKANRIHLHCRSEESPLRDQRPISNSTEGQFETMQIKLTCAYYSCNVIAENSNGENSTKPSNTVYVHVACDHDPKNVTTTTPFSETPPTTTQTETPLTTENIIIICGVIVSVLLLILIIILLVIHRDRLRCCNGDSSARTIPPSSTIPSNDIPMNPKTNTKFKFFQGRNKETATPASKTEVSAPPKAPQVHNLEEEDGDLYQDPESLTAFQNNTRAPAPVPIQKRPPIPLPNDAGEAYDQIGNTPTRFPKGHPPPRPLVGARQ